MKVVVTGHTRGIGAAISDFFQKRGDHVVGFSTSQGSDLVQDLSAAVNACESADILINNAPIGFNQVTLLYEAFEKMKVRRSWIFVIGSNNTDGVRTSPHPHSSVKYALEKAVEQLQYCEGECRVVHLKLGYVDTPRVLGSSRSKLSTADVVETVKWILSQPEHVHVRSLYLSHQQQELS